VRKKYYYHEVHEGHEEVLFLFSTIGRKSFFSLRGLRVLRGESVVATAFHGVSTAALSLVAAGCDPVVNIGGTFFPGWMVAILVGSALTAAIRYVFVFTRLEPHIGPLALIYTSLGLFLSVVSWLILYRS
jgi:hypothetical protein